MTYQPQHFTAPDGTEMVVLRAQDYARLQLLAEDGEDVAGVKSTGDFCDSGREHGFVIR